MNLRAPKDDAPKPGAETEGASSPNTQEPPVEVKSTDHVGGRHEGATQAPTIGKGLRVYSDDDDEKNRFLTLAMGECWHSLELGCPVYTCKGGGFICGLCRDFVVANNDFVTDEDFPRLRKWVNDLPALKENLGEIDEASWTGSVGRRAFVSKVYEVLRKMNTNGGER